VQLSKLRGKGIKPIVYKYREYLTHVNIAKVMYLFFIVLENLDFLLTHRMSIFPSENERGIDLFVKIFYT